MTKVTLSTTPALEVASYFFALAAAEEEPTFLTPLGLQKLLYYAQGWAIAEWGHTLYSDALEAWPLGPVAPAVWQKYQGKRPIMLDELPAAQLSEEQKSMIAAVWSRYKMFSPIALSHMTHEELPWMEARNGLAPSSPSNTKLSLSTMAATFAGMLTEHARALADNWDEMLIVAAEQGRTPGHG